MKHAHLLYSLALFGTIACTSTAPTKESIVTETTKSRIDSTLNAMVAEGWVAGASALIYENGQEAYFHATGFADQTDQIPMDRNTLAIIYSMTKPITGVALMTLYEKGAFQLDDPLEKYAPEFANMKVFVGVDSLTGELTYEPLARPITIRDITRHTAGFPVNPNQPGLGDLLKEANAGNPANTLTQMAEKMGQTPLAFQPGTQWAYGPSVDVQAFLVERLSGQPYGEYVRQHVLDPLGMNETRYVVPESEWDRLSAMYRRGEDGVLVQVPDSTAHAFNRKEWPMTPGGYGLTSTLDDYMKFTQMLVNGGTYNGVTILKPETVQLMATNQLDDSVTERMFLPSKGNVGFGIDFAVRVAPTSSPEENHGIVGEFFWDGAASTLFWVDPENKLTAVLFVQIMPFAGRVHKSFRDAVYGPYQAPKGE